MQEKTRILKITGEGKTSTSPDTIIITLTISGENKDYQKAMADADNSVMDLKTRLVRAGFDEKKITTEDFRVRTINKYIKNSGEEKRVFDKYEALHELQIKFEFNTQKLARVIDVIVESVAEPSFNINFTLENTEKLKEEALKDAVKDATNKAKLLSKSAGVVLGEILSIDHSFSEVNVYTPRSFRMAYDGAGFVQKASASMESLNVQDITVDATVTITWEIK